MKRFNNHTFHAYCTYREDMAQDMGAKIFGGSGTASDSEAVGPLVDLIKEIWMIDREGVMSFFSRYKDDPRAEGTNIAKLIEELESGKSRVSSMFGRNKGAEKDQIVPPPTDMDAGDGEGDGGM